METAYLNEFLVLAETKNYLQASEDLYISQSSLSKHIKALESEIGVPLFDRSTRKVTLTRYGISFYKYAKQMLDLQYAFLRDLEEQRENRQQYLRIGSIPLMASYQITDIIARFQNENPTCQIQLLEGESAELKDLLRKNECDLAFIREENAQEAEFARFPYTSDHLVAVLPNTHPLAGSASVSLEELKEENFLLLPPSSLLYQLCITSCQKEGFVPNITYTGKRAENIVNLVEKGMGVSLLMEKPISSLTLSDHKVSIINVEPRISTYISIYYKKNITLSAAAKRFMVKAL